jgi:hypothetical protein
LVGSLIFSCPVSSISVVSFKTSIATYLKHS